MQSGVTNEGAFERVYGTGKYELRCRNKYNFTGNIFSH
jgi:hypothetical protein